MGSAAIGAVYSAFVCMSVAVRDASTHMSDGHSRPAALLSRSGLYRRRGSERERASRWRIRPGGPEA